MDNGPWVAADLSNNMSVNSWRQWVYAWDATPGNHRIRCRATDGTGGTQTSDIRPPAPRRRHRLAHHRGHRLSNRRDAVSRSNRERSPQRRKHQFWPWPV